jgi:hypothetical protein
MKTTLRRCTCWLLPPAGRCYGLRNTLDLPEPPHTPRVALAFTLTTAPRTRHSGFVRAPAAFHQQQQRVYANESALRGRPMPPPSCATRPAPVVERYRPLRAGIAGSNLYF